MQKRRLSCSPPGAAACPAESFRLESRLELEFETQEDGELETLKPPNAAALHINLGKGTRD